MSYPTPMDISEAEDRAVGALDEALEQPYSREVWAQIDAERLELLAANDCLSKRLVEAIILISYQVRTHAPHCRCNGCDFVRAADSASGGKK